MCVGYLIAWASEACSIRTGFPYGWYSYVYENMAGEWMNGGVPVWDSLSYVFLCYAGMSLTEFVTGFPPFKKGGTGGIFKLALLSALFVTLLDIIIDPLANRGEKWFLGNVYDYPEPGFYFGVPLSNFAGWFLVSFMIVGFNVALASHCERKRSNLTRYHVRLPRRPLGPPRNDTKVWSLSGPHLYFAIFLFNWAITLWIKEWGLALADLFWISIPAMMFMRQVRTRKD